MSSQMRFRTWLGRRKATIQTLQELADQMDSVQKTMLYTKLAGTTAAVASGLGALFYVMSAPFTGGLSLSGLATVGLVGGVMNLGTTVGNHFIEKELLAKTQKTLNADREACRKLRVTNPDISGRGSEIAIGFETGAATATDLATTKKPPPYAIQIGGIVTRVVAANPGLVEYVIALITKSARGANNATRVIVELFFAIFIMVLLPIEFYELLQTSIKCYNGSMNESAKMVRIIAGDLDEEMKHNERLGREQMD